MRDLNFLDLMIYINFVHFRFVMDSGSINRPPFVHHARCRPQNDCWWKWCRKQYGRGRRRLWILNTSFTKVKSHNLLLLYPIFWLICIDILIVLTSINKKLSTIFSRELNALVKAHNVILFCNQVSIHKINV